MKRVKGSEQQAQVTSLIPVRQPLLSIQPVGRGAGGGGVRIPLRLLLSYLKVEGSS